MKSLTLLLIFLKFTVFSVAGDTLVGKRFIPLICLTGTGYVGGVVGMNALWYKDYPKSSFHFYNDWHEWKQVDKIGHFTTAAIESMYFTRFYTWAGVRQHAALWGAATGILLQAPIEFLDGFNTGYGASVPDMVSNILGASFIYAQYQLWDDIKIQPRFSFHTSPYARIRPNVLGNDLAKQILKDYNGQTYWFSFNLPSILEKGNKIPPFIDISFGYGAEGMVFAFDQANESVGYRPFRQYYLSLDVNWSKIKTSNKFLKVLFYNLNFIHLPFPAVELNRKGLVFHPLYF